jgi:hypothetical protein
MIAELRGKRRGGQESSNRCGKEPDLFETETHPTTGVHSITEKGSASRTRLERPTGMGPREGGIRETRTTIQIIGQVNTDKEARDVKVERQEADNRKSRTEPQELRWEGSMGAAKIDAGDARVTAKNQRRRGSNG